MGVELAAIVSVVVPCCGVAAIAALVALALLGQRRQARRFAHAWQPFATQVGGQVTAPGTLASPRVTWRVEGQRLMLESYRRLGESNDRTPYTRMRLSLPRPAPDFGLRSRQSLEPGLVLQTIARTGLTTGNPALDSDYLVTNGDADRLGRVFDATLLNLVREAQAEPTLWLGCAVRDGQPGLEIEERGEVTESTRLTSWQNVLLALALRWPLEGGG